MGRLVWLLMASRGTSRGERVKGPVDAVLTLVVLVYLSKEKRYGVHELAILCNAAGEDHLKDQQILVTKGCSIVELGDECQPAVASSSRPVACVAKDCSCSAHEASQAPCYKGVVKAPSNPPTLRSRASTCSSSKGKKKKPCSTRRHLSASITSAGQKAV